MRSRGVGKQFAHDGQTLVLADHAEARIEEYDEAASSTHCNADISAGRPVRSLRISAPL